MILKLEPNFVRKSTSLTHLTPGSDKEFPQDEKLGSNFVKAVKVISKESFPNFVSNIKRI